MAEEQNYSLKYYVSNLNVHSLKEFQQALDKLHDKLAPICPIEERVLSNILDRIARTDNPIHTPTEKLYTGVEEDPSKLYIKIIGTDGSLFISSSFVNRSVLLSNLTKEHGHQHEFVVDYTIETIKNTFKVMRDDGTIFYSLDKDIQLTNNQIINVLKLGNYLDLDNYDNIATSFLERFFPIRDVINQKDNLQTLKGRMPIETSKKYLLTGLMFACSLIGKKKPELLPRLHSFVQQLQEFSDWRVTILEYSDIIDFCMAPITSKLRSLQLTDEQRQAFTSVNSSMYSILEQWMPAGREESYKYVKSSLQNLTAEFPLCPISLIHQELNSIIAEKPLFIFFPTKNELSRSIITMKRKELDFLNDAIVTCGGQEDLSCTRRQLAESFVTIRNCMLESTNTIPFVFDCDESQYKFIQFIIEEKSEIDVDTLFSFIKAADFLEYVSPNRIPRMIVDIAKSRCLDDRLRAFSGMIAVYGSYSNIPADILKDLQLICRRPEDKNNNTDPAWKNIVKYNLHTVPEFIENTVSYWLVRGFVPCSRYVQFMWPDNKIGSDISVFKLEKKHIDTYDETIAELWRLKLFLIEFVLNNYEYDENLKNFLLYLSTR